MRKIRRLRAKQMKRGMLRINKRAKTQIKNKTYEKKKEVIPEKYKKLKNGKLKEKESKENLDINMNGKIKWFELNKDIKNVLGVRKKENIFEFNIKKEDKNGKIIHEMISNKELKIQNPFAFLEFYKYRIEFI